MLRRLTYIPYYIIRTPLKKFTTLWRYAKIHTGHNNGYIFFDMLFCSLRYNISYVDYFELRFFELNKTERGEYMGSGAMYEFQLKMNPRRYRTVLSNKIKFLEKFNDMAGRRWATLDILLSNSNLAERFLKNNTGRIVLKNANGQAGKQVAVYDTIDLNKESLIAFMQKNNYDLIEEYVVQHNDLMKLSPSGLNTLRIITQIDTDNNVVIIAARLRISVNSKVDNISAGNFATHVDITSGKIAGPGIYYDITKPDVYVHPVTGIELNGFKIPLWEECINMVTKAALDIPENRSIGWDVAVTDSRPVLIEGNHNWHYFLWQMPERKGYKKKIMAFAGI